MGEEAYFRHLKDTMIHKRYFLDSAWFMAKYLLNNKEYELALNLLRRANVHDNSKLSKDEIDKFIQIQEISQFGLNPKQVVNEAIKGMLTLHYNNNKHHPEHYADFDKMSEIDVIEMVCDWHSRAVQCNSSLMDFVTYQQEARFHFSDELYHKILHYCEVFNDYENDLK